MAHVRRVDSWILAGGPLAARSPQSRRSPTSIASALRRSGGRAGTIATGVLGEGGEAIFDASDGDPCRSYSIVVKGDTAEVKWLVPAQRTPMMEGCNFADGVYKKAPPAK